MPNENELSPRPETRGSSTAADTVSLTRAQDFIPGIERALAGASRWDKSNLTAAIKARAEMPGAFTTEDALEIAGVRPDPEHPNLAGAITVAMAKTGVIIGVGYARSRRASRAGGICRLWLGAQYLADVG
jgi:hypothetical protein